MNKESNKIVGVYQSVTPLGFAVARSNKIIQSLYIEACRVLKAMSIPGLEPNIYINHTNYELLRWFIEKRITISVQMTMMEWINEDMKEDNVPFTPIDPSIVFCSSVNC